jgi:hypothetical protein
MKTLSFAKPVKKTNMYVAKVVKDDKAVRLVIPYAKFVGKANNILRVWIAEDSTVGEDLRAYDAMALNATMVNNEQWFNNALDPQQIDQFFRHSVNNNVLSILISDVRTPVVYVGMNKSPVESIDDVGIPLDNAKLSIEIEIQGLYFFSQRFGLRYILRTICVEEDATDEDMRDDEFREDVENEWSSELQGLHHSIAEDISEYEKRIEMLRHLKLDTDDIFESAKTLSKHEWDANLTRLTRLVGKYYNGTIFICNKI